MPLAPVYNPRITNASEEIHEGISYLSIGMLKKS